MDCLNNRFENRSHNYAFVQCIKKKCAFLLLLLLNRHWTKCNLRSRNVELTLLIRETPITISSATKHKHKLPAASHLLQSINLSTDQILTIARASAVVYIKGT